MFKQTKISLLIIAGCLLGFPQISLAASAESVGASGFNNLPSDVPYTISRADDYLDQNKVQDWKNYGGARTPWRNIQSTRQLRNLGTEFIDPASVALLYPNRAKGGMAQYNRGGNNPAKGKSGGSGGGATSGTALASKGKPASQTSAQLPNKPASTKLGLPPVMKNDPNDPAYMQAHGISPTNSMDQSTVEVKRPSGGATANAGTGNVQIVQASPKNNAVYRTTTDVRDPVPPVTSSITTPLPFLRGN